MNQNFPNPKADPFGYLRLVSRSRRQNYDNTAGNEMLDAINTLDSRERTLLDALHKIAQWDDTGASRHLASSGSYSLFDEPGSVQTAREALNAIATSTFQNV